MAARNRKTSVSNARAVQEIGDFWDSHSLDESPELREVESEVLEEYDFSKAEIGKYARRYAEGTNVVVLEPDVAAVFKTAEAVNKVLREHLEETAKSSV